MILSGWEVQQRRSMELNVVLYKWDH
jgi:hypothetical protein